MVVCGYNVASPDTIGATSCVSSSDLPALVAYNGTIQFTSIVVDDYDVTQEVTLNIPDVDSPDVDIVQIVFGRVVQDAAQFVDHEPGE
jgi:hypothetical protein